MAVESQNRELALPPGVFAFMQDMTKGGIKTYVGPIVINQTGQERPVIYNAVTRTFQQVDLGQAVVKNYVASEGDYVVLENPPENGNQPKEGSVENMPTLRVGMKVNLPGPCCFALWPTQAASVIPGHTLRSNQYLVARVYNAEEAKKNWAKACPKEELPEDLSIGKLFNIKGTEVSGFWIPPTGFEVAKDDQNDYVRDAVTLERLEYAVLVDEDGNKRYEIGPQVVFPEPTEQFFLDNDGNRKFKAEELTGIQGLHIKVIADYEEGGVKYVTGQELFIKGDTCAIYYPRPEHSIIQYGDKRKHYATAIPVGEGRYIMNRDTGEIRTEKGPKMSLPDPRKEAFVRRILSEKECGLWYPGNPEAKAYNLGLRTAAAAASAKGGYVTESQLSSYAVANLADSAVDYAEMGLEAVRTCGAPRMAAAKMATPDQFTRNQTYTPPRQITLDTKFEGVPSIRVWTGYAVMVVDKRGNRRVVQGPDTVLLDYDETLEVLELSTGKPKTTDKLERTVYLRVSNNKVSDIVQGVYTKDHVPICLKLSYRVNFEGEPEKWFDVENYVKFLCDHLRSLLKGAVRKLEIADFYENGAAIIRDIVLGKKEEGKPRPLQRFEENGMVVSDVEILMIQIEDKEIERMLAEAQHEVVASNIDLDRTEKNAVVTRRKQEIERETQRERFETTKLSFELETEKVKQQLTLQLANQDSQLKQAEVSKTVTAAKEAEKDLIAQSSLERTKAAFVEEIGQLQKRNDLDLTKLRAEVEAVVARFNAAQPGFSEAVLAISRDETMTKVAQAASVQTMIGGQSVADFLQKIFQGTPAVEMFKRVTDGVAAIPAARR